MRVCALSPLALWIPLGFRLGISEQVALYKYISCSLLLWGFYLKVRETLKMFYSVPVRVGCPLDWIEWNGFPLRSTETTALVSLCVLFAPGLIGLAWFPSPVHTMGIWDIFPSLSLSLHPSLPLLYVSPTHAPPLFPGHSSSHPFTHPLLTLFFHPFYTIWTWAKHRDLSGA